MKTKREYYSSIRKDIVALFPAFANRLLDVGCGTGETAAWLKEHGRCRWAAGVEAAPGPAAIARSKLDALFEGDIEKVDIPLEKKSLDVIVCADVLEHLRDPKACLGLLKPLLKEGGLLIASVPNVRYWKVSIGLLFGGRWDYADQGVLDKTHLRFFVRSTVLSLFRNAGFEIQRMDAIGPQREFGIASWLLDNITFGFFRDILTVQYIVVASMRKKSETTVLTEQGD